MNTFKSVVSTLSLLVAVCALLYTVWSSHQARRLDALQEVRRIAVPNLARFNGILNAIVMGGPPSSPEEEERVSNELNKLPMLYAEVREAYIINLSYFRTSSKREIDGKINSLETAVAANPGSNTMTTFKKMAEIMQLIELGSR
ncbi:MAG: hypothetical protein OXK78_02645 [Caldilineaceae bacterium]|nr:hypothetical protein [Caldilineaceae bacterium]